jgi:hypothetical protein
MSETNGWPGKPGVPMNPERDGPHWLKDPDSDRQFVVDWSAASGWRSIFTQDAIAAHMLYAGPCLTPAEMEARIATARKDALEEAARWHDEQAKRWQNTYAKETLSGLDMQAARVMCLEHGGFHIESAAAIRALKGEGDD